MNTLYIKIFGYGNCHVCKCPIRIEQQISIGKFARLIQQVTDTGSFHHDLETKCVHCNNKVGVRFVI